MVTWVVAQGGGGGAVFRSVGGFGLRPLWRGGDGLGLIWERG